MKSLSFYEQQHLQRLFQQEGQIKYLFDDFVRRVSPLLAKWSNHGSDRVWIKNTRIENAIDKELTELHTSLLNFITDATIQSWNRGNRKADDLVRSYIEGMSVSEALRNKMFSRNADALNALLRRKDNNGFTVSERVWNIADGMKDNLEYYLSSGVSVGRPAVLIGQDVRQLLNEPDRRFRRVRNEEGKLIMSKPMAAYHPGQGVYRSAYKNALRLTATQTNIGFRQADSDRWQKMDFVLGIEIKRSNNNHGPCKICDAMVGKYSKGFVFTGFHPFCICYATPIMMNQEEFADFLLDERIPESKIITSLPAGAEKFIRDNKEQLSRMKPYWYKDNFIGSNKPSFFAEVPKKEKRIKTDEEKADIQKRWDDRKRIPSANMPSELVSGGKYLHGEEYIFDKHFFDLINPDSKIKLEISKRGSGAYYHPGYNIIHLSDTERCALSNWYRKSVVYHEFGHAIDDQRLLFQSQALLDMRNMQKERLKRISTYKIRERIYDYDKECYVSKTYDKDIPEAVYLYYRLTELSRKIFRMNEVTFTKRGITRKDVLEQIGSVKDTLQSFFPQFAGKNEGGHNKKYWKIAGMKEKEYIAHAFENTFIGNTVFKKYLPEMYNEMVAYIRQLKKIE